MSTQPLERRRVRPVRRRPDAARLLAIGLVFAAVFGAAFAFGRLRGTTTPAGAERSAPALPAVAVPVPASLTAASSIELGVSGGTPPAAAQQTHAAAAPAASAPATGSSTTSAASAPSSGSSESAPAQSSPAPVTPAPTPAPSAPPVISAPSQPSGGSGSSGSGSSGSGSSGSGTSFESSE